MDNNSMSKIRGILVVLFLIFFVSQFFSGSTSMAIGQVAISALFYSVYIIPIYIIWYAIKNVNGSATMSSRKNLWEEDHHRHEPSVSLVKEEDYSRRVPYDGYFPAAVWALNEYYKTKRPSHKDIIKACLISWSQKRIIAIRRERKKGISGAGKIIFYGEGNSMSMSEPERELYGFLAQAATRSNDGIAINENELLHYCRNNCEKQNSIRDSFLRSGRNYMMDTGLLPRTQEVHAPKHDSHGLIIDNNQAAEERMEAADDLIEFMKFLRIFSTLHGWALQKQMPVNVEILNDYLVYSALFGFSDAIVGQFKAYRSEYLQGYITKNGHFEDVESLLNTVNSLADAYYGIEGEDEDEEIDGHFYIL